MFYTLLLLFATHAFDMGTGLKWPEALVYAAPTGAALDD
jgi:hypothetical protein